MMAPGEIDELTRRPAVVRAHPETAAPPRWLLMCRRLYEGGTITLRWLQDEFGVSLATAKRDMALIEANLPTVRDPRERASQPVTIRLLLGPRVQGHINDEIRATRGRKGSLK
jgi:predicted DNA-binding transcriptional regulator YafY